MRQAMMIDYEFYTGCHSCETACKKEKGLDKGQFGIKLFENGPWKIDEKHWQYDFIPAPPSTQSAALPNPNQLQGRATRRRPVGSTPPRNTPPKTVCHTAGGFPSNRLSDMRRFLFQCGKTTFRAFCRTCVLFCEHNGEQPGNLA